MMPSWSIERLENWAAVWTGMDGGSFGNRMPERVERIEGGLVDEVDEEAASC
jgi:hypothetical protein